MLRVVSPGRGGGQPLETLDFGTAYINGATVYKTFGIELTEDAYNSQATSSPKQDIVVRLSTNLQDIDEALSCETSLQWASSRTPSQTESKLSVEEFSSAEDSDSTLEDDYDEMVNFVQSLQDEQIVLSRTDGRRLLKLCVRVQLLEQERSAAYLYLKQISGTLIVNSHVRGSASSKSAEVKVPFVGQVGLSTFECDVSQVLFSECVMQGTYYKDFTVWNRSEIPLLFRIPHMEELQGGSKVVSSIASGKGSMKITEYDSRKKLRLSRGVKVAGFSHIRLRLSYRPEAVGDHDCKFFIFNANGSGPKQTVQVTVHAHVSLMDESQTRVLEIYNVSKDKHKVMTILNRLDFGDCFVEDINTRRVQLFNKGMTDLSLNLSSKGHASADPSAEEIFFALAPRLKSTTSEAPDDEDADAESQDEMDLEKARRGTSEAEEEEEEEEDEAERKEHRQGSVEAKLTRVSSIVIPAKKTVELLIQYVPRAWDNIDDERVMQQASPKLTRREFMLLFKSDTFVHTLHAQSRVCLSVVMVDKEVLNFHDCNIGTKKSQRLSLHNYSDLPTVMKIRNRSKVVSVFLEDAARTKLTGREHTEGKFVIKSRQTRNLVVFFEPRKVNANYVRDIEFENTNRSVNNKFYVRVMASNMDPHHIIYHSLFYKFTPVHYNDKAAAVDGNKDAIHDLSFVDKDLQNEPALDFGSITENSPSLRCLELENVTDKPISLQLNVSRPEEMDLYIQNDAISGRSGSFTLSEDSTLNASGRPASSSTASRNQSFFNRRRSQSISLVASAASSGVSPMQPLGSSPPTLSTRPLESALASPTAGSSDPSVTNSWGMAALAKAFHAPRLLTYSGMSSVEEETVVAETAERIQQLERAVESRMLLPIKGETIVLRARSKLLVGLVLNSRPTGGNGKLRNLSGSIRVRLLNLDEEAKEELRDVHRWGFRSEYSTVNDKQEPDFENVPDRAIPMRARVAKSIMSFTQRHFNFGVMRLPVNHRLRRTLILNNESAVPLLYEITTTRSIASSFINLFTNRRGMIPAFGQKKVEFEFVPTLPGNVKETLTIVNIANRAASKSVIVKAQVVRPWRFSILDINNYDTETELNASLHRLSLKDLHLLSTAKKAPALLFTLNATPKLAVKNIQERTRVYMLRWGGKGSCRGIKGIMPEFKFTVEGGEDTEISPEVEDQIEQLEHKLRIATRKNNMKKVASLNKKLAVLRAESLKQVKRLPVLLKNKDEWCTDCSLSLEGGDTVNIKIEVHLRSGDDRSLLQLSETMHDCEMWYSSFELFDSKHRDVIKHIGVMCAIKRYQRTRPTVETTAAVQPQHAARVHTPSPVRTPDLLPRSQHSPIAITPTYSQQKPTSKKQQQEIISVHPKTVDFGVVLCEAPESTRTFSIHNQSKTSRAKFSIKSSSALQLDHSSGILRPQETLRVTITAAFNRGGRESFVLALKADLLDTDTIESLQQAAVNILVQVNVLFVQFMDLDPNLKGSPRLLDLGFCYSKSFASTGDQATAAVARKVQFRIRNVFKEALTISAQSNLKRQVLICRDAALTEGVQDVVIARHQVLDLWVAVKPRLLREARNGACRVLTGGIRVHGESMSSKETFQTTLKFQAVVGMTIMRVSKHCLDFGTISAQQPLSNSFQVINVTKKMPLRFRVSVGERSRLWAKAAGGCEGEDDDEDEDEDELEDELEARYGKIGVDERVREVAPDAKAVMDVTLDVADVRIRGYRVVPLELRNETVPSDASQKQSVLVRYLVADAATRAGPFQSVELTTTCIVPAEDSPSTAVEDGTKAGRRCFVVTLAGEGIVGFTNPSRSTALTIFPVSDTEHEMVCKWLRPQKVVKAQQLSPTRPGLMRLCGDGVVVQPKASVQLSIGMRCGAKMELAGPLLSTPTPLGMLGFAAVDAGKVEGVLLDDCVKAIYALEGSLRISRFVCPKSKIDIGKIGAVNNWRDNAVAIEVYSEEGQGMYDSSPFELDITLDAIDAPGVLVRAKHVRELITVTISFDKEHRYSENVRFQLRVSLRNRSNESNKAEIMVQGIIVARVVEFIMDDKVPDLSVGDEEEELPADPGTTLRLPALSYPNDLSAHPLKCNTWFKMQNAFDTPIQCRLELLQKLQFRHLVQISLLSRITNRKIPRNQVSLAVDESFDVRTVMQLKPNVSLPEDLQLNKYYQVATILVTAHCGQDGEQSSRAVTVYGKLTRGQHFSLSCRRLTFFMEDVDHEDLKHESGGPPAEDAEVVRKERRQGTDPMEISKPSTRVSARKRLEIGTEEQSFKINNLSDTMPLHFETSVTSVYNKGLNLLLHVDDSEDEDVITDTICPHVFPQTGTVSPGSSKVVRVGLRNYTDFVAKFSLDESQILQDAEAMQVAVTDDMGNKETIEVVLTGEDRRGLGPDPLVPDLQLSPEERPQGLAELVKQDSISGFSNIYGTEARVSQDEDEEEEGVQAQEEDYMRMPLPVVESKKLPELVLRGCTPVAGSTSRFVLDLGQRSLGSKDIDWMVSLSGMFHDLSQSDSLSFKLYTIDKADGQWLRLSQNGGKLTSSQQKKLNVTLNFTAIALGTFSTFLIVENTSNAADILVTRIHMQVVSSASLLSSPAALPALAQRLPENALFSLLAAGTTSPYLHDVPSNSAVVTSMSDVSINLGHIVPGWWSASHSFVIANNTGISLPFLLSHADLTDGELKFSLELHALSDVSRVLVAPFSQTRVFLFVRTNQPLIGAKVLVSCELIRDNVQVIPVEAVCAPPPVLQVARLRANGQQMQVVSKNIDVHFHVLLDKPDLEQHEVVLLSNTSEREMRICLIGTAKYFNYTLLDAAGMSVQITAATSTFPFDSFTLPAGAEIQLQITVSPKVVAKASDQPSGRRYYENHLLLCNYTWNRFAENKRLVLRLRLGAGEYGLRRGMNDEYHLEQRISQFLSAFHGFWSDLSQVARKQHSTESRSGEQGTEAETLFALKVESSFEQIVGMLDGNFPKRSGKTQTERLRRLSLRHCMIEFALQLLVDSLVHSLTTQFNSYNVQRLVCLLFSVSLRHELFASCVNDVSFKPRPVLQSYFKHWLLQLEAVLTAEPFEEHSLENMRQLHRQLKRRFQKF